MSLSRLMLRALACVALQKQASDSISPTMADDRVFDSMLDPLMFRQFDKQMPGIVVYTDDGTSELINRGSGGGPYRHYVDLRVELVIGTFNTEIVDNQKRVLLELPTTDAQLEAQLDLFEAQAKWALMELPRAYTNAFMNYVVRIESVSSFATRDEGNNRFASRRLHFKCEIKDDCPPLIAGIEPGQVARANATACGFKDFPAAWLTPMFAAMCSMPSMRPVLNALSGSGVPYAYVPLLRRIGVTVDSDATDANSNTTALGPSVWELPKT